MPNNKTQLIRIADVFIIAPVMIYAGVSESTLKPAVKVLLIGFGIATAVYNANNYLKNR